MTNKEFRKKQVERSAQQRAIDGLEKMTQKDLTSDKPNDKNWVDRVYGHKTPHVERDSKGNIVGNDNYYVDRDG